uniref:Phospholipid phosphatase 2 n=1 Tax=Cacopsylla melanoneura TaxID=428564 RepID=A0A8D8YLX1_9HEMI
MKYEKAVLLVLAVTLTIITELDLLPQIHRMGFYCGDPKLSHKYNGDTVTAKYLLIFSFILPLLILFDKNLYQSSFSSYLLMYVTFIIGYCLCISSVNFFKILFGEPRPHFFDTCKPDEALKCTPGSYISTFTCINSDLRRARDSTKSFPSGHSALSTFSAGFVLLYISNKASDWKWIVQALCILWILSCTVTRIFDHRHHWWDVLSGIVYGMGVSFITLR